MKYSIVKLILTVPVIIVLLFLNSCDKEYEGLFEDNELSESSSGGGNSDCTNTCQYSNDGMCDDGGAGSSTSVCDCGTDCDDCGTRSNNDCSGGGGGGGGGSNNCGPQWTGAYNGPNNPSQAQANSFCEQAFILCNAGYDKNSPEVENVCGTYANFQNLDSTLPNCPYC